ncbi:MAG: NUDIX domain-containing protein [Microcoleaceae cyanobacterium]
MEKPIGCVVILINDACQVLLVLRDDKPTIPFPNTWNLPGGFLDGTETPTACIRREMIEEIEIDLGEPELFRYYQWPDCDEYIFWKKLNLDLAQVTLNEGQKLAYFSLEQIRRTQLAFECNQIAEDFFAEMMSA